MTVCLPPPPNWTNHDRVCLLTLGAGRARDELLQQKAMLETLVRLLEAAINGGELDAGRAQAIADDARVGSTKALAGQFLRMQQAAKKLARSPQDFLRRLFSSARNAPSEPEGPPACPGTITKVKKRLVQTYLVCSGCKLSINANKCRQDLRYILLGHMEAKGEDTPDLMSFVCKFCPVREQFKLGAFKTHVEQLHPWVRVLGGHLEEELLQQTDKDHVARVSTANTT